MSVSEENKDGLFKGKKNLPDFTNDGDTISQSKNFNNTKYIKKWDTYWKGISTDINYSNSWKIGEYVQVVDNNEEFGGKKGKIILGFSKNPAELKVEFKDGGKKFIDKSDLNKISIYDYLEE